MLKTLKFVQGAVAKKDFVPALTHFQIKNGFIQGFNGHLSLGSPIECDLDVTPKATTFIKAIAACKEDIVALSITKAGKLSIKSGKFRAYIECTQEPFPEVTPEGTYVELPDIFIDALKSLRPFVAEDASRPWATGILFNGCSAYATNNIIVVEKWLGTHFPVTVNIPKNTIDEIIRLKEKPLGIQLTDNSITFHYPGNKWLRSNLSSLEWPDLTPIFNKESNQFPIPEELYTCLEDLLPFVDSLSRVFFLNGCIATSQIEGEGASIDLNYQAIGCFHIKQLLLLKGVANTVDLTQYPAPCLFYGDNLRGAIVGIRI